ncbi:rhodanese-like domain-containing protein [Flavilitoribacter nigricans]|uniref:Sulfurtransferase n=1 Tax=Flavilitoribacter nigricans (strain ATCC 23147 / DSM 23189 / NBRC 102662 / NCIMB 1420 / SS-2) TaxID=1122177 RepID=A0A2D0NIS8_FLAN2|nr:rhodanese-like domain-containing protein [Flavilitoribacter nigricans]PHN08348.1 sulfurtransferase [Flavilitoribacter nigricans DSM 23189 = NBRC 102662]
MINFFKKLFGGGVDLAEVISRDALVVDVRTPEEYRRGHPDGAINIPLNEVDKKLKELTSKKVPVVTCCASGRRSGIAARRMQEEGIEAYNGGPWQRVQRYL